MSDSENTIPDEEIPIKKTRKKKEMTPEMLEQLRIAREKAIAVKKAMKDNPEKRVEHYKEKIKKIKEKPKTKKELMKQAEEELEKEQLSRTANGNEEEGVKGETPLPEPVPVPEPSGEIAPHAIEKGVEGETPLEEPKQELDNNGFPLPPKEGIKKPAVPIANTFLGGESDEEDGEIALHAIEKEVKKEIPLKKPPKKKQVKYVYESGTSDEEDQIVYIKKRMEKPKNNNVPPAPFTPTTLIPPSLIGGASRFGSYSMYRR